MNERTGIGELKGIGEKTEKLFHRLGVYTVGDLLRHYPRGYDIYEAPVPIDDLTEGRIQTVSGLLSGAVQVSPNRKMPVTTVKVAHWRQVDRLFCVDMWCGEKMV